MSGGIIPRAVYVNHNNQIEESPKEGCYLPLVYDKPTNQLLTKFGGNIVEMNGKATKTAIVPISSAQILAIDVTPILLVPAQGVGTIIMVRQAIQKFTFVTTDYSGGTGNDLVISNLSTYNAIDQRNFYSRIGNFAGINYNTTSKFIDNANITNPTRNEFRENDDLVLRPEFFGQTFLGGDSTMVIQVIYSVVTV